MRYLELKIEMNRDSLEAVSEALAASGFDRMIINDPADYLEIEEHPEWYKYDYINEELAGRINEKPEITIFFSDDEEGRAEASRVEALLKELRSKGAALRTSVEELSWSLEETADDSEWLYKWQEHFKTTKVGAHIVVKPSWEDYEAKEGELVIEMDPGMAFGSGLHETTALCIKALETIAAGRADAMKSEDEHREGIEDEAEPGAKVDIEAEIETEREAGSEYGLAKDAYGTKGLEGLKVLDVGCGTGILSIAAALLGAGECLGIDIDDDAVRIASENVERNGLTDRIRLMQGDLTEGVDFEPDIIVANLMADLVIRLSPDAAKHLKLGGIYISSGILDIKCDKVAAAVEAAGFVIENITEDGEWRAIVAGRR